MEFNSLEEVKTFVKNHLKSMKVPATDEWNNCVMRAPDGSQCAVGCTIPPDVEEPNLYSSFKSIWDSEEAYRVQFNYMSKKSSAGWANTIDFFGKAQTIHDKVSNWTVKKKGLKKSALKELEAL